MVEMYTGSKVSFDAESYVAVPHVSFQVIIGDSWNSCAMSCEPGLRRSADTYIFVICLHCMRWIKVHEALLAPRTHGMIITIPVRMTKQRICHGPEEAPG